MKTPRVFITRKLPDEILKPLYKYCDVEMFRAVDEPIPRDELLEAVSGVSGILCMLTERIDRDVMDAAGGSLHVVSNMAVGVDNIDLPLASSRNIIVCNTPDVLTESTADLTFALLLGTARRIVEANEQLRDNKWTTWSPFWLAGQEVYGKTIGIVGLGRIGEAVARRARGFGMKVLYHSKTKKPDAESSLQVEYSELGHLLRQADFVVLLTPLTDETRNLIGAKELSLMKETAILINTSRGAVVDESALIDALKEQRIWGAGIDVFEREPIQAEHPLLSLPNVLCVPHIGSATIETRSKMADLAVSNLLNALNGENPRFRVT